MRDASAGDQNDLEELAKGEIEKTKHVIDEIITLRQNQKKHLVLSRLNVSDVIEKVICDLSNRREISPSIDIELKLDRMPPIYTDQERLYKVLYHVIFNAMLYHDLEKEKRNIILSFELVSTGVIIIIADNGQGIDKKFLPRIFDMFYRISKRSKGSGLGLYIAQEVMFQLQGRIELVSILGEGTTVRIHVKNLEHSTIAINFPRYDK